MVDMFIRFLSEVSMKNKIIAYLKDESGQTSTEYILLVFVAAFIVMKFKDKIEEKLLSGEGSVLNKVFGKVDDQLQGL
jgi:pilus assembly protein Flp/PilA